MLADLAPGDLAGKTSTSAQMPHLSALFAKSAVADLSVRGVGRVPSLADGYVTIGAGTRSVGHPDNDGECLEPDEPFDQSTARRGDGAPQRSAREHVPDRRRSCVSPSTRSSRATTGSCSTPRSACSATALEAAGVQRAVIGNGDTTLTPSADARLPAMGRARVHRPERNRCPPGDVGTSLLERDPERAVRACASIRSGCWPRSTRSGTSARRVARWSCVEDSDLLRLQSYGRSSPSNARCGDATASDGAARRARRAT